jgi:hypothetical protein
MPLPWLIFGSLLLAAFGLASALLAFGAMMELGAPGVGQGPLGWLRQASLTGAVFTPIVVVVALIAAWGARRQGVAAPALLLLAPLLWFGACTGGYAFYREFGGAAPVARPPFDEAGLDAWIAANPNVRVLDLSNHGLEAVPEALRAARELGVLDLRFNRISQLPEWLADLPGLGMVWLHENPLTDAEIVRWQRESSRAVAVTR